MKKSISKKMDIEKESLYANSDMLIVCIGFSVILLGALSATVGIPKEFTIGASLAGMFFAIADLVVSTEKVSKSKALIYIFSFMFGAISFVFVPAFLMVNQTIGNQLVPFADSFGLVALGIVIISIGNRIHEARVKQIRDIKNMLKEMIDDTNQEKNE